MPWPKKKSARTENPKWKRQCRHPKHNEWQHKSDKLTKLSKLSQKRKEELQSLGFNNIQKAASYDNASICHQCLNYSPVSLKYHHTYAKKPSKDSATDVPSASTSSCDDATVQPSSPTQRTDIQSASSVPDPTQVPPLVIQPSQPASIDPDPPQQEVQTSQPADLHEDPAIAPSEESQFTYSNPDPIQSPPVSDEAEHLKFYVETVIKHIDNGDMPSDLLHHLTTAIARAISVEITMDLNSQDFSTQSKTADSLQEIPAVDFWLCHRSPLLTCILETLTKKSIKHPITECLANESRQTSRRYKMVKAVEVVYNLRHPALISPFSLAENLTTYALSNSQLVTDMHAHISPAGSYGYLRNWLADQSKTPVSIPNEGDLIVAFDNDQVVGKTYHLKPNNKVNTCVVTSLIMGQLPSKLQENDELMPGDWISKADLELEDIKGCMEATDAEKELLFCELEKVVGERIRIVKGQQKLDGEGNLTDDVDCKVEKVRQQREHIKCIQCGFLNSVRWQKCRGPSCKALLKIQRSTILDVTSEEPVKKKPRKSRTRGVITKIFVTEEGVIEVEKTIQDEHEANHLYGHIPTNPVKVHLTTLDPAFCNPNSYATVKQVLRHIGKLVHISRYTQTESKRKWCAVVCDGLPYVLAQKVIRDTLVCECGRIVDGKEEMSSHQMEEGHQTFSKEFDWVLLQIGLGHVEMNCARSFIELNWEVFMSEVAWCMGFRSENAQKYAKKGSDHHKTWELLRSTYLGTIDELLVPYIRECINQELEPSAFDYLTRWCGTTLNPKYEYMHLQIMTYLHSLMVFRGGVRCNNQDYVSAGMAVFGDVIHGRNHPKYQAIFLNERRNKAMAPPEVKNFQRVNTSISYSGDPRRCEGMDFQLERVNKASKTWLPRGVPCNTDWLRVFRLLDKLDGIKKCTEKVMGLNQVKHTSVTTHEPDDDTVMAWRVHLRDSRYISDPKSETELHTSMTGIELDDQLVCMPATAQSRMIYNMRQFYEDYVAPSVHNIPQPVFVTAKERDEFCKISNKTVDTIKILVLELIDELDSPNLVLFYKEKWKKVKNKKKEDLISFYEALKEEVDDQLPLSALVDLDQQ